MNNGQLPCQDAVIVQTVTASVFGLGVVAVDCLELYHISELPPAVVADRSIFIMPTVRTKTIQLLRADYHLL